MDSALSISLISLHDFYSASPGRSSLYEQKTTDASELIHPHGLRRLKRSSEWKMHIDFLVKLICWFREVLVELVRYCST